MGAFVLGILVGWLAEWLFYTFKVKAGEGNGGDCSSIKAELELKNRQISSLQTQLASASESTQSNSNSPSKQSAVSAISKTSAPPKTSTAKASGKTSSKSKAKAKPRKAAAKTPTAKKSPAAKNAATKTSTKTSSSKTATSVKAKTKAGGDDFTKLSGIGPSMSAALKSLGVDTFQKLAATDDDILRDMLEVSGARMNNNKEAMDSWNEQATVAAKGDFKALKAMQAALKK